MNTHANTCCGSILARLGHAGDTIMVVAVATATKKIVHINIVHCTHTCYQEMDASFGDEHKLTTFVASHFLSL